MQVSAKRSVINTISCHTNIFRLQGIVDEIKAKKSFRGADDLIIHRYPITSLARSVGRASIVYSIVIN